LSATATPALEISGVTKRFGPVTAVKSVSFNIAPGEVVGLAGENGAGKSTVKNMIGGLLRPDAGEMSHSFGGFIRGTFSVTAQYGLVAGATALVFGVPFAPLILSSRQRFRACRTSVLTNGQLSALTASRSIASPFLWRAKNSAKPFTSRGSGLMGLPMLLAIHASR
jgi:energy-coupling factor transporter ATP-binding protein EcfA2